MNRLMLTLAAAAALVIPLAVTGTASAATPPSGGVVPAISAGGYQIQNFDYSYCNLGWQEGYQGSPFAADCWSGLGGGDNFQIGSGTGQQYYDDAEEDCVGYYNENDSLVGQDCNNATYQQFRSENTSHGWLIWSVWFASAYPGFCRGGYQAVVTVTGVNQNLYLACPVGGVAGSVWGEGQYWAASES